MSISTGIIIQARTGSSRLPNKVLMPFFEEQNLLELIVNRIKTKFRVPIIIATTTEEKDQSIVQIAKRLNVQFFQGDEHNVLNRFIKAAEAFNVNNIIRVCPDNPFLDIDGLDTLFSSPDNCDYTCFTVNGTPSIRTHFGFWAEKVTLNALLRINDSTKESIFLEHVTNYIYTHADVFKIRSIDVPGELVAKNLRLTMDTLEDYNLLKQIFAELMDIHKTLFTIHDVVQYIRNKELYLNQMKKNILRNEK